MSTTMSTSMSLSTTMSTTMSTTRANANANGRRERRRDARVRAALDCGERACALDATSNARAVTINTVVVRAKALRQCEVVNHANARVRLEETFGNGKGKNVVVVLRHLG